MLRNIVELLVCRFRSETEVRRRVVFLVTKDLVEKLAYQQISQKVSDTLTKRFWNADTLHVTKPYEEFSDEKVTDSVND